MDAWFEAATAVFGVFLERKFEIYASASMSVQFAAMMANPAGVDADSGKAAVGDAALITDLHLRSRPVDGFADDIEEAVFAAMEGLPTGFGLETDSETSSAATLYGELTATGIRQVAAFFSGLVTARRDDDDDDGRQQRRYVLWDLGSGTGRVVFETTLLLRRALSVTGVVVDGVGVEYCVGRHEVAQKALAKLVSLQTDTVKELRMPGAPPVLVAGDFFERGATPIVDTHEDARVFAFCCGVGFDDAQCRAICDRLLELGERLVGAVLLFKNPPMDHPLLRHRGDDQTGSDEGGFFTARLAHVSATWMDEAPAVFVTTRARSS